MSLIPLCALRPLGSLKVLMRSSSRLGPKVIGHPDSTGQRLKKVGFIVPTRKTSATMAPTAATRLPSPVTHRVSQVTVYPTYLTQIHSRIWKLVGKPPLRMVPFDLTVLFIA